MRKLIALLGISMLLCLTAPSRGQEVSGTLQGRVLDIHNAPVPNVNILVKGERGSRGTSSDEDGYFRLPALPVGAYTVEIEHVAYQQRRFEKVIIRLGKTTHLGEIRLPAQEVALSEVVVTEEKVPLDFTSTTTGGNLNAQTYEVLPIERNYRSIVTLLPQVNQSYLGDEANISGSTGPENVYYIDGINVTDPFEAMTATNLPYNFVKEIEVKSGGYEAEYGRALGGIVNVITYSGSNEFRGQVFGFFNNNRLTGEPLRGVVQSDEGDFLKFDIGMSLSGPLVRDKLWFFAAYNPNVENEDIEVPGFGIQTDEKISHIFAGKLTWQATSHTNVVLNLFGDLSYQDRFAQFWSFNPPPTKLESVDPLRGRLEEGGINISLNGHHTIGNHILLEANISRISQRQDNKPADPATASEPLFMDLTDGVLYAGGYGTTRDRLNRRTSANVSGTLYLNRHTVKAGLEYENNFLDNQEFNTAPGVIRRDGLDSYNVIYYVHDYEVGNRVLSLYLQDSWQAFRRLRLNWGVRLDAQYFVAETGEVAQSITDQYQPRLGFTYQPGELGTQKIYGSFGRFYEQIPTRWSRKFGSVSNGIIFYDVDPRIDSSNPLSEVDVSSGVAEEIEGLEGQHSDEFNLGYERMVGNQFKVGIGGVYRTLRQVVDNGYDFENQKFVFGNPGKGKLSYMPEMEREYRALEVTLEKFAGGHFNFFASYVLSRSEGNYEGLFQATSGFGIARPNALGYDWPDQHENSQGLLFNDRTHVFKFHGSYRFDFGLTLGTAFIWQSGTPLNELGRSEGLGPRRKFLQKRGSVGRSPAIWDLNLRFTYHLKLFSSRFTRPKLILDILHFASEREAVVFDQVHYFGRDSEGNQTTPNPNFLKPLAYQPPMTVRLGMEVEF